MHSLGLPCAYIGTYIAAILYDLNYNFARIARHAAYPCNIIAFMYVHNK